MGKKRRIKSFADLLNEKNEHIEKLEKFVETQRELMNNASKILIKEFGFKSNSHIVDHALAATWKYKQVKEQLDSITFKDIIKYANNKGGNHGKKLANSKITKTVGR